MKSIEVIDKQLLFFRHSPVVKKGICYGQSEQVTQDNATTVADLFIRFYKEYCTQQNHNHETTKVLDKKTIIWSSPAPRCLEPAQLIAQTLHVPLNIDPRLYELSFGLWENLSWDEIELQYKDEFHQWMEHWKVLPPPQGESLTQFQQRIVEWQKELDPQCIHILIGHAGVWRAIQVYTQSKTWDDAMSMKVPYLELIPLVQDVV